LGGALEEATDRFGSILLKNRATIEVGDSHSLCDEKRHSSQRMQFWPWPTF